MTKLADKLGKVVVMSLASDEQITFVGVCPVRALVSTYAIGTRYATAFYSDNGETFAKLASKIKVGNISIGLGDFAIHLADEDLEEAKRVIASLTTQAKAA